MRFALTLLLLLPFSHAVSSSDEDESPYDRRTRKPNDSTPSPYKDSLFESINKSFSDPNEALPLPTKEAEYHSRPQDGSPLELLEPMNKPYFDPPERVPIKTGDSDNPSNSPNEGGSELLEPTTKPYLDPPEVATDESGYPSNSPTERPSEFWEGITKPYFDPPEVVPVRDHPSEQPGASPSEPTAGPFNGPPEIVPPYTKDDDLPPDLRLASQPQDASPSQPRQLSPSEPGYESDSESSRSSSRSVSPTKPSSSSEPLKPKPGMLAQDGVPVLQIDQHPDKGESVFQRTPNFLFIPTVIWITLLVMTYQVGYSVYFHPAEIIEQGIMFGSLALLLVAVCFYQRRQDANVPSPTVHIIIVFVQCIFVASFLYKLSTLLTTFVKIVFAIFGTMVVVPEFKALFFHKFE